MEVIELNFSEKLAIQNIVTEYKHIENNLTEIQDQLQSLADQQEDILKKLDNVKTQEFELFSDIEEKYGKGSFDLYTMKYIKK